MNKKGLLSVVGLYMVIVFLVALGNGMSDTILANYFKDAYEINSVQRGIIEFPREMPGFLCAIAIALLSFMGDVKASALAHFLSVIGCVILGVFTPSFGVMLIFLFLFSLGQHLFIPLQDSIAMSLADPEHVGKRLGQFNGLKSAAGFISAIIVFVGFRQGWLSFKTQIKVPFLVAAVCFLIASALLVTMAKKHNPGAQAKQKVRLIFRKEYKYYYMLTIVRGVQKQIAFVYGTWVIVDLLLKGADVTALLTIVSSFICIFFLTQLGKWMDQFGIKKMMYVDALTFIFVYVFYGVMVLGINKGVLPTVGWPVIVIYGLYIMDRLSMQIGMVNAVYLRSIALSEDEVTQTLSAGLSLDHLVSITAAFIGGFIWQYWGSHWIFFIAAFFSLGNVVIAYLVNPEKEHEAALKARAQLKK